jgi:choline transport protein
MPVDVSLMNWNSVILVGTLALTGLWWLIHARKNYPGPKVMALYIVDEFASSNDGPASKE